MTKKKKKVKKAKNKMVAWRKGKKKVPKKKKLTKKQKTEIEKIMGMDYLERERIHEAKATKALLRWCKRYYPEAQEESGGSSISAPKIIAKALKYFDFGEKDRWIGQLYLEWVCENFVAEEFEENFEDMDFIYQKLVEYKYTENNQYEYNDMDNHIFYLPSKKVVCKNYPELVQNLHVFALESQSLNYIVVKKFYVTPGLEKTPPNWYIYRYWDRYLKPEDKWDKQEEREFKKRGKRMAILHARWLVENFSDNLPGQKYGPHRPDLRWYKKTNFKTTYQDSRDGGFIAKWEEFGRGDSYIGLYPWVESAFHQIRWAFEEMRDHPEPQKESKE